MNFGSVLRYWYTSETAIATSTIPTSLASGLTRLWAMLFLAKMLPTLRQEFPAVSVLIAQEYAAIASDQPNHGYWDASNSGWDAFVWRRGEEKFVIFAAMEGEAQFHGVLRMPDFRQWDCALLQIRPNPALLTDMHEIDAKAVADIDHGGSEVFFAEKTSDRDARS